MFDLNYRSNISIIRSTMWKAVMILFLAFVCPASAAMTNLAQTNPATKNFDGYMLALMWIKGECSASKCNQSINPAKLSFTIHGLWPASLDPNSGVYGPIDCAKASQFSSKKYSLAVQTSLQLMWPSTTNPNEFFWKHEYEKHGSCWLPESADLSKVPVSLKQSLATAVANKGNSIKVQEGYFLTTFALTNVVRLEAALTAAGFPARQQPYKRADFVNAVKSATKGQRLSVICVKNSNVVNEIRICFDKNYQPANCAKDIVDCAGKDLMFTP